MAPVEVPQLHIAGMACQGAVVVARGRPTLVWCVTPIGCHSGWPADGRQDTGQYPATPTGWGCGRFLLINNTVPMLRCPDSTQTLAYAARSPRASVPARVCANKAATLRVQTVEYRDLTRPGLSY